MSAPDHKLPFTGLPLGQAPAWLRSYLDCCDGALALGGSMGPGPRYSRWALFRGKTQVGIVKVRHDGMPIGPGGEL